MRLNFAESFAYRGGGLYSGSALRICCHSTFASDDAEGRVVPGLRRAITLSHHQCRVFQPFAGAFTVGIIMMGTKMSVEVPTVMP